MVGVEEIIVVGGVVVVVTSVALYAGMVNRRGKKLDKAYHDTLHAESVGDYDRATELYEAILSVYGNTINQGIWTQIRQRIETIRHQKEYLRDFRQASPNARVKQSEKTRP